MKADLDAVPELGEGMSQRHSVQPQIRGGGPNGA
jgi:hypothetical protein